MKSGKHTIGASTKLTGVIGWPVEHSLSPVMHNAAFGALGLDWAYLPLPVYPDHLGDAIRGLLAMGFAGANVTVPHKQAVMKYMDDISQNAQVIGAVNTIRVEGCQLYGDNTDATGFLRSLQDVGFDPHEASSAVLGAGGAARAIVHALAQARGREIVVFSRRPQQAQHLCGDLSRFHPHVRFVARDFTQVETIGEHFDLLVNATPVGMWPEAEASPWPAHVDIPAHLLVCDLIYNPAESLLLTQARAAGAEIRNGLGMLVAQGALAFEAWTGIRPPTDVMTTACLQALLRSDL